MVLSARRSPNYEAPGNVLHAGASVFSMLKATVTFTPRDSSQFIREKIVPGVIAGVAAAQGLIVDEAQAIAPVRSGDFRESIHALDPVDDGKCVRGEVISDVPHAVFVETGTGIRGAASPGALPGATYSTTWPGMESQPTFRPALDTVRRPARDAMASAVRDSLKG